MKKIIFLTLTLNLLLSDVLFAQDRTPDFMRSVGKMYVVVAVIVAVFLGIVLFLTYLDKRLTRLENQIHDNDQKQ
jgi:CcmD family protein